MAKGGAKSRKAGAGREAIRIRWERKNIALFGGGILAIVIGYILLSQGDITLAPLLLVGGYCVLIPLAFIL
ncbi:MAG TPA: hypothetical protein VFR10_13845 [bacterium]|nr:hypothetical protein [bacterium]